MAATWQFVSGAYTITYGVNTGTAVNIGTTKSGPKVRIEYHKRDIMVDELGDGPADALNAGMSVFVDLDYVEYLKVRKATLAMQDGITTGTVTTDMSAQVGKLLTAQGGVLTCTPMVRTNNNQTYIFNKAILCTDIPILLSSALREGPITFQCYPQGSGSGGGAFYTETLA